MDADPLERHRAAAPDVLAEGDPEAIKRLYVDLGNDFWEVHGDGDDAVPLLSMPETHPVVAAQVAGTTGMVLDAGCGPHPALALRLAESGERTVVALDIGLGTVRVARAVGERRGVRLLGVVADVERLPFREGVFSAVVCDDTIEHLPDDEQGAAELARVARPGAPVVLATPNRHSLAVLRRKVLDRLRGVRHPASAYYTSNSHLREYTWRELERIVAPSLTVRRRIGVPFPGRWKARLANRFVLRRPFYRLSPMIVLVTEPRRSVTAILPNRRASG